MQDFSAITQLTAELHCIQVATQAPATQDLATVGAHEHARRTQEQQCTKNPVKTTGAHRMWSKDGESRHKLMAVLITTEYTMQKHRVAVLKLHKPVQGS
jgi:hypothetical protein